MKTTRDQRKREINVNLKEVLPREFDILALVFLDGEGRQLHVDRCRVYLLPKEHVTDWCYAEDELSGYALSPDLVDKLFAAG